MYVDICRYGSDDKWLIEKDLSQGTDPFYTAQGISQLIHLLMPYLDETFKSELYQLEQQIHNLNAKASQL